MDSDDKVTLGIIGCWLTMFIGTIAFWCLVGYGIWTLIQYMQARM